jgi:hypothetical protein
VLVRFAYRRYLAEHPESREIEKAIENRREEAAS